MITEKEKLDRMLAGLAKLCGENDATLFARTDGKRPIVSLQVGSLWKDFKRVDRDGSWPIDHPVDLDLDLTIQKIHEARQQYLPGNAHIALELAFELLTRYKRSGGQ